MQGNEIFKCQADLLLTTLRYIMWRELARNKKRTTPCTSNRPFEDNLFSMLEYAGVLSWHWTDTCQANGKKPDLSFDQYSTKIQQLTDELMGVKDDDKARIIGLLHHWLTQVKSQKSMKDAVFAGAASR